MPPESQILMQEKQENDNLVIHVMIQFSYSHDIWEEVTL